MLAIFPDSKEKKETDRSLPFSVENSLFFVLTVDVQFILKFYMGSGVQLHKPSVPNRHFVVEWGGVEWSGDLTIKTQIARSLPFSVGNLLLSILTVNILFIFTPHIVSGV